MLWQRLFLFSEIHSSLFHNNMSLGFSKVLGYSNKRLHFPSTPGAGYGHVTKDKPIKYKQKYCVATCFVDPSLKNNWYSLLPEKRLWFAILDHEGQGRSLEIVNKWARRNLWNRIWILYLREINFFLVLIIHCESLSLTVKPSPK